MGGDEWKQPFPVFREIYSNALDEGDAQLKLTTEPKGIPGITQVLIEYTEQYVEFFEKFDNYFTHRRTDLMMQVESARVSRVKVFPHLFNGNKSRIYRKGILAFEGNIKSLFTYDLDGATVNESRVLNNINTAKHSIYDAWNLCDDEKLFAKYIQGLAGSNATYFEHHCLQYDWRGCYLSDTVKRYLESKKWVGVEHVQFFDEEELQGRIPMPIAFLKHWNLAADLDIYGLTGDNDSFLAKPIDTDQFEKLETAKDWLKTIPRYKNISKVFKFEFGVFPDQYAVYAKAVSPDIIRISHKLFDKSSPEITKILIEEVEHLKTGFGDKTRGFQDHLFDLYYNELEKVKNLRGRLDKHEEPEKKEEVNYDTDNK